MTRSSLVSFCVACAVVILFVAHKTAIAHDDGRQHVLGEFERQLQSPIHDSLVTSSIIPDVLDDFSPTYSLHLTYPSTHSSVTLGNTLSVPSVKVQPVYQFAPLLPDPAPGPVPPSRNRSFTLVLTDPDAKSRSHPIWSEYCHWIVANVSRPELLHQPRSQVNNGKRQTPHYYPIESMEQSSSASALGPETAPEPNILESYYPPSPPKGSGFHRYVFVLLEGNAADSWKLRPPAKRKHWGYGKSRHGVRDWAAEHGLEVVGANFFYARNEAGDADA